MIRQATRSARRLLLYFASNEVLFLFAAFLSQTVLVMGPLEWYREIVDLFSSLVVTPWGMALCLLRLERRSRLEPNENRTDLTMLAILTLWIVIPFALRFGPTFNTMYSWFNHIVVFFGVYAFTSEEDAAGRERLLDLTGALFAVLGAVLTVPMIWCIRTGAFVYDSIHNMTNGFGFNLNGCLQFGLHYNTTAMYTLACCLFALIGFFRRKSLPAKLLHLIPALAMMGAVVFSQSRTSRYVLLLILALGCFGWLVSVLPMRSALARWGAALLAALIVLVVGFFGMQRMTDAMLRHIAQVRNAQRVTSEVLHREIAASEDSLPGFMINSSRAAYDSAFSDRTMIWKNLLSFWRENPKYLFIGNGMGNTGRLIVHGTVHESIGGIAVHNAYLQFIADYGLIGFALLAAFLCLLVPPMLRILLAPKGIARPGDRVLVMLAAAQLIIGLMESQPLGAMSTTNIVLFFSLALIRSRGQELRAQLATAGRDVL